MLILDRTADSESSSNFKIELPYSITLPENTVFFVSDIKALRDNPLDKPREPTVYKNVKTGHHPVLKSFVAPSIACQMLGQLHFRHPGVLWQAVTQKMGVNKQTKPRRHGGQAPRQRHCYLKV